MKQYRHVLEPNRLSGARRTANWAVVACCALGMGLTLALPEDANQNIFIEAHSSDVDLDRGLTTFFGSEEEPVRISQGSMLITGTEIEVQRENGVLRTVVATGKPAHFQQQLEPGQPLLHASGFTLTFDNAAQVLTIEQNAQVFQEGESGYSMSSHRVDYDLRARRGSAVKGPDGEPVRMVITPNQDDAGETPATTPDAPPTQD